jgi:LEA14-like dessication related protein
MMKTLLLVTSIFLASCTLFTVMGEKPDVEVIGVSIQEFGLKGGTIQVECLVKNNNKSSIELDSIGYTMSINENPVAAGEMKEGIKLRGKEEKRVAIPIAFSYKDMAAGIGSIFKLQKLDYTFAGSAKAGMFTIPFTKKGQLETKK